MSAGVRTRGSLGRFERMEVWVEETARRRSMVVRVQDGMMAMDIEKLAARAVKAVEGHLIGVNGGPAGIQEGSRCADGGRRKGGGE